MALFPQPNLTAYHWIKNVQLFFTELMDLQRRHFVCGEV